VTLKNSLILLISFCTNCMIHSLPYLGKTLTRISFSPRFSFSS